MQFRVLAGTGGEWPRARGLLLLIALGLSLIFSVGGVVNLAHGAFFALGAYASVEITNISAFGPAVVLSAGRGCPARHPVRTLLLRRFYTADPI